MNENDWAWAAGLFEGEGSIKTPKKYLSRALSLSSTDEDVINKFFNIVQRGNIYKRSKRPNGWKDLWEWKVGKYSDIEYILKKFLPYLGQRRKEKALIILNNPLTYGRKTHCKYGHLKTFLDSSGYGRCIECQRRYSREKYRREHEQKYKRRSD